MPPEPLPNNLLQDCLAKLQRVMDLALKTAEAASREGNHKLVLQAVREVNRIAALIHKMTRPAAPRSKAKPQPASFLPDSPGQPQSAAPAATRPKPLASPPISPFSLPDLGALLHSGVLGDVNAADPDLLADINRTWGGLLGLAGEMVPMLPDSAHQRDPLPAPR